MVPVGGAERTVGIAPDDQRRLVAQPRQARLDIREPVAAVADLPAKIHIGSRDAGVGNPAATYFLSRQTLVPTRKPGMARWREHLFAAMVRNAETPMTYFALPIARVVELGSQVEI